MCPQAIKRGWRRWERGGWDMLLKQPHSPLICPSAPVPRHHRPHSCFLSAVIPCTRSSTSHYVSLFSHCLMALEPAMLPWEPAGDSRHPLHLFSFIPFGKWIRCFAFRLSWKTSWLQSPKFYTYRMLNLALESKDNVAADSMNLEKHAGKNLGR